MKLRTTLWLQVCLCLLVGANAALGAAAAANPADVPSNVRTPNGAGEMLNKPSVLKSDLQILELARASNDDVYQSLQSFVCNEKIDRFKGPINGAAAKSIDTVTAKLSFEKGSEQYTEVHQNNHVRAGMSSIPGAWSEGEFGTLLIQTQQLLQTQHVAFDSFVEVAGVPSALYRFDVASEDSPWDLQVADKHYKVSFRTNVWIAVATGEILKIERSSLALAPETRISEIQWGITLDHVDLNGKQWLLPRTGNYAVLYQESRRREFNVLNFSDYKRYGAETALSFN